jgi:bacteriorhodopsin
MALNLTAKEWNVIGRLIISVVVLIVALYVILAGSYPDATVKWAFGAVGIVLGYWLR